MTHAEVRALVEALNLNPTSVFSTRIEALADAVQAHTVVDDRADAEDVAVFMLRVIAQLPPYRMGSSR